MSKQVTGATLGLDLSEDAAPLDWKALDALIDARHARLGAERAERETAEAEAEARRAAMEDAAEALEVSAEELAEALEAERDALEVARLEYAEWQAERADSVQEYASHAPRAEAEATRVTLEAARRSAAYQAASLMLSVMPRRANVMLSTRYDSLTVHAFTLEPLTSASEILPRLRAAERLEARRAEAWDVSARKAEAEARVSRWNRPKRQTAASLEITQRLAHASTRVAHKLRAEYAEAANAPRYAFRAVPVATLEIPAELNNAELIKHAEQIAANVPARNDVHPFPSKLGRGAVTGSTQATKPGTKLNLATRATKVVDPFDSVAEAKREARRKRDARRTGQTVSNRHAARVIALQSFQAGLELLETARAHQDSQQIADERRAEDKVRRAAKARERRARETAEDKAARNMYLRNKRRAAKQN